MNAPGMTSDSADYVVVGSGAGGATVAHTLSAAGADVLIVEEGPEFPPSQRTESIVATSRRVLRSQGYSTTLGRTLLPYLQASCVGGTTVVNGAIVWRLPEDVLEAWYRTDPGLAEIHNAANLESCYEQIERELNIAPTDAEIAGIGNDLVQRGCEALGWAGRPIRRNVRACQGSARCLHGCPVGAKQSMEATYIPWSVELGTRLYTETEALSIQISRGRAKTVVARSRTASGEPAYTVFEARKGVVVCAGAVHTPALLRRSGIGARSVGNGLMCHPGVSMAARFPEQIDPWAGATQGYEVTEHRGKGVKLETLALAPEFAAMRLPQAGSPLTKRIAELNRCFTIGAAVKAEAVGRVRPTGRSGVSVRYSPTTRDAALAHRGLWAAAEVFRAAGAEALIPSVSDWPAELDAKTAPEWIRDHPPKLRDLKMAITHLLGGAHMGSDPRSSVVSPTLAVHGIKGLYVADASVFPTNTGVNPQHTIMALAMNAARSWLD